MNKSREYRAGFPKSFSIAPEDSSPKFSKKECDANNPLLFPALSPVRNSLADNCLEELHEV